MLRIRTNDDPILRQQCSPVDKVTPDILRLSHEMQAFMAHNDAIGLAANQVGQSVRVITINTRGADPESGAQLTLINPEIIARSDMGTSTPEGCLSLPDQLAIVPRHMKISVKYTNIFGKETIKHFINITAVCVQHEIDHLNGVLMLDYQKTAQDKAPTPIAQPEPV